MATAAFRSTTDRSAVPVRRCAPPSVADAGSSNRSGTRRRSRSLSRYSGRLALPASEHDELLTSRGPSGSREISLDDLADEFLRARAESEEEDSEPASAQAHRRRSVAGYRMQTESSRQRGRSMSRPPNRRTEPLKGNSDGILRRRRSVCVARQQRNDSENDINSHSSSSKEKSWTSGNRKLQQPSSNRQVKAGDAAESTGSSKDFLQSHNSYLGSNDKSRMSKHLTDEAEKFFEDFLSNIEDTDISSFDGERSDTSSNIRSPGLYIPASRTASLPVDADDVLLPWLQWETSTEPPPCKSTTKEPSACFSNINQTASSFGSWSPEGNASLSAASSERIRSKFGEENHLCCFDGRRTRVTSSFDIDEYTNLKQSDELLFERFRQRLRIDSGGMILCGRTSTLIR